MPRRLPDDPITQGHGWPVNWYLSNPARFYIGFMFFNQLPDGVTSILPCFGGSAQSSTSLRHVHPPETGTFHRRQDPQAAGRLEQSHRLALSQRPRPRPPKRRSSATASSSFGLVGP